MERYNILVVEDDQNINRLLCKILEDGGYCCRPAFSGSEAMLWAGQYDYDLILLDLMLPKRNGFDVCRAIREQGRATPILMLTARDEIPDKIAGLDHGADD